MNRSVILIQCWLYQINLIKQMRIVSLLIVIVVIAFAIMKFTDIVENDEYDVGYSQNPQAVEKQVNQAVSDYQKKLKDALNKSGSDQ